MATKQKPLTLAQLKKKVKSWADVVKIVGKKECELPFPKPIGKKQKATNAFHKLSIIIELFKQGRQLDYSNWNEGKYYPYFRWNGSGFAFAGTHTLYDLTSTTVGPRLSSLNRETAAYIGSTFPDIYNEMFEQ